jgi:hypothetical protein
MSLSTRGQALTSLFSAHRRAPPRLAARRLAPSSLLMSEHDRARERASPLLSARLVGACGGCPIYGMLAFMAQEVARGRSRARRPVLGGEVGAREEGRDWGGGLARDGGMGG